MNEQEEQVQREIEVLERDAADPLASVGQRHALELRAYLLRNGYRLVEIPASHGAFQVMHAISGEPVMGVSVLELQYARMGKQEWVEVLDRRHRKNLAERRVFSVHAVEEHT